MEKINAALDVYSIIICLLMIVYLANSKSSKRATGYFRAACAFNIVMMFGDLTDWCCNGLAQPWYPAALHIGQFIYYVSIVPPMMEDAIAFISAPLAWDGEPEPTCMKYTKPPIPANRPQMT